DEFPSLEGALACVAKMKKMEEKVQRVFASTVDLEEAARCRCECCPPRESQEPSDYCCASLFSLPLLEKTEPVRDGLLAKMPDFASP
ncbi:hypothetical protein PMAYCL1PPCAC_21821, partial [Pristionchus mayeri]